MSFFPAHGVPVVMEVFMGVMSSAVHECSQQKNSSNETGREQLPEQKDAQCLPEAEGCESADGGQGGVPQKQDSQGEQSGNPGSPKDKDSEGFECMFHIMLICVRQLAALQNRTHGSRKYFWSWRKKLRMQLPRSGSASAVSVSLCQGSVVRPFPWSRGGRPCRCFRRCVLRFRSCRAAR